MKFSRLFHPFSPMFQIYSWWKRNPSTTFFCFNHQSIFNLSYMFDYHEHTISCNMLLSKYMPVLSILQWLTWQFDNISVTLQLPTKPSTRIKFCFENIYKTTYSKSCQRLQVKQFAKTVNGFLIVNYFHKALYLRC